MIDQQTVQHQIDNIGYFKEFTVVFTKKDGTQRKITGWMEPPVDGKPRSPSAVAVKVTKGDEAGQWRSFRIDSVLGIFL